MRGRIRHFSRRFDFVLIHRRKLARKEFLKIRHLKREILEDLKLLVKKEQQIRQLKNEVLEELKFHPKYMSKKLLDYDLESMFEEYGY